MTRTEDDLREAFRAPLDESSLQRLGKVIGELADDTRTVPKRRRPPRRWLAPALAAAVVLGVAATVAAVSLADRHQPRPLASSSAPVACGTASSAAPTSRGSDGWTQALQNKLAPYVQKVYAVIGHDAGYGDIGLDFHHVAVQVWYHGPLPAKLQPVIAEAHAAGIGIEQIQTGWGEKALDQKILTLARALQQASIDADAIGPANNFTAISVAGPRVSVDVTLKAQTCQIAARTIGNIPIVFVPDPGPNYGGGLVASHLPPSTTAK